MGELGWELHAPRPSCLPVYQALMTAGAKHGLVNAGYRAIDSLSIEKGVCGAWTTVGALSHSVAAPSPHMDCFPKPPLLRLYQGLGTVRDPSTLGGGGRYLPGGGGPEPDLDSARRFPERAEDHQSMRGALRAARLPTAPSPGPPA